MALDVEQVSAVALALGVPEVVEAGAEHRRQRREARNVAAEVATEVASKGVQVCGAYGTMVNAPFNRFFRDAKTYEIGGSSEVLKNTLGKYIIKQAAAS